MNNMNNMKSFLVILILLIVSIIANASNVLELTPDNFDKEVGKDKFALVEFFAPWCGHCKNLAPIYEQLADAFSHAKDRVIIAKVDADNYKDLGNRFAVNGFPTLKWFDKGVIDNPEDYEQNRDLDGLSSFVEKKSGVKSKIKKAVTAVTVLTSQTFNEIALDPENNALVEFYAPWCGHCKNLAPTYEKVAKDYAREPNCIVANLDATEYKNLAEKYEVHGFPTIKFFPKGENKTAIDYEGGRSEHEFINFLNENCGTHRLIGGELSEVAGKIPELDDLASKFINAATEKDANSIIKESKTFAEKSSEKSAQYYVKVMNKIKKKKDYIETETVRLDKIIKSGTISGNKIDDFTIRKNILESFRKEGKIIHQEL